MVNAGLVNHSPVGRFSSTGWLLDVIVNQPVSISYRSRSLVANEKRDFWWILQGHPLLPRDIHSQSVQE